MKVRLALNPAEGGCTLLHTRAEVGEWIGSAHRHDELEANLVLRGTATCIAGNRRHLLSPGTLLWLLPEDEHLLVDQSADYEMWVMVFAMPLAETVLEGDAMRILRPAGPADRSRRLPPAAVRELAMLSWPLKEHGQVAHRAVGSQWLLSRAVELFGAATEQRASEGELHPAVRRVARVLCEDGALRLGELARSAGVSEAWLSRLFKSQTGVTVTEFRNQQRLQRFLRLMGGRKVDMLSAATSAGFRSYAQFHRVFRRAMGESPRAWKSRG